MWSIGCALLLVLSGCGRVGFDPVGGDARIDARLDAGAASGLIAWWKLDETSGLVAADSVGTADATLEAVTGAPPTWGPGQLTGGLQFVGDGDAAGAGTPALFATMPTLSVSAWIYPTDIAVGQFQCVVDKSDGISGWVLGVTDDNPGDVSFTLHYMTANLFRVTVGGLIANTWQRVAVTWDGSPNFASVHIYINGSELAYAREGNAMGAQRPDGTIGLYLNCNAGLGLKGGLDDVRIYNRALSPAELP